MVVFYATLLMQATAFSEIPQVINILKDKKHNSLLVNNFVKMSSMVTSGYYGNIETSYIFILLYIFGY